MVLLIGTHFLVDFIALGWEMCSDLRDVSPTFETFMFEVAA